MVSPLNRSSHVTNFGGIMRRGMNVCDCRRSGFERRTVREQWVPGGFESCFRRSRKIRLQWIGSGLLGRLRKESSGCQSYGGAPTKKLEVTC
eukprot:scaffold13469_cov37-Cyclotella_meneghiniana.AAC.3